MTVDVSWTFRGKGAKIDYMDGDSPSLRINKGFPGVIEVTLTTTIDPVSVIHTETDSSYQITEYKTTKPGWLESFFEITQRGDFPLSYEKNQTTVKSTLLCRII
jgi:hypothetical protein